MIFRAGISDEVVGVVLAVVYSQWKGDAAQHGWYHGPHQQAHHLIISTMFLYNVIIRFYYFTSKTILELNDCYFTSYVSINWMKGVLKLILVKSCATEMRQI